MKKFGLVILVLVIVCFFCYVSCNSNDKNEQLTLLNGKLLTIEPGDHWQGRMKLFLFFSMRKTPQFAIWIENNQGDYISTVFATGKSAKNNWQSAPKEGRPETLPVWNHKRQINLDQIDIVSSATPKGAVNIQIDNNSLIEGQEYNIYLEINHSFDYNNFWTESSSGVNGQPSLIYHAKFAAGSTDKVNLIPIGHGSIDGSNGNIVNELETLTTALTIIKDVYMVK
ncbi:MAG: hypothetical protein FWD28_07300 [Treponema sp.]|nr:hypothetical protein [Treponema sp.]